MFDIKIEKLIDSIKSGKTYTYSVNWPFLMLFETKYLIKIEGNKNLKKGSLDRFEIFNSIR